MPHCPACERPVKGNFRRHRGRPRTGPLRANLDLWALCPDCHELFTEQQEIAAEAGAAMRGMMEYKGK